MADSSITWDLIARDRASSTVGRVGDSVDRLAGRVGRLAAAFGGAFAFQQAGEFALKMADNFELARSRLETITRNIGSNFDAVSGQVDALDKSLAQVGFTNADVEGSVASLETATKSVGKAIHDTALAADIARGRNISLEEATRILMRVETGHVSMLSKLGIATKDANGHLLTQQQALQALASTYGGAASNYAQTFAGKQAALRAQLANSAATIGADLLPAAVDLAKTIQTQVLPVIQQATHFFDAHRQVIEKVLGVVLKLGLAYKALKITRGVLGEVSSRGAATALESSAFSMARPLPVFVTNPGFGGGGETPPVVAPGGAKPPSSGLPTGVGLLPLYALGTQSDVHVPQSDPNGDALFRQAVALSKTLQGAQRVAGERFLKNVLVPARFSTATLQEFIAKFGPAVHGEKSLGAAATQTTVSLENQAKALANLQTRSIAVSQGQDDLRQAVHNMAVVAGQQASRALKGNSDAALANRDALRGAVTQAENYLALLQKHGASAQTVANVELNLARAIKRSADQTYGDTGAVGGLLRQLGFLPSQIQAVTDALVTMNAAWNPIIGSEHPGLSDFNLGGNKANAKAAAAGKKLANSLVGGYTPVVSSGVAAATSKALNSAAQKAQQDVQTILGYYNQTKSSLISAFGTISTQTMTDSLGGSFNRAESVKAQLKHDAQQMHIFARLWHRLDDLGLNPALLGQFAGPDYIPAMRELLRSGRHGIREINRYQRQISRDAASVAVESTADKYNRLIAEELKNLPAKDGKEFEKALRRVGLDQLQDPDRRQGRRVAADLG